MALVEDTRPPASRPDPFRPAVVFPLYAALATLFFLPALLPGRQIYGTDYLGSTFFWETFASSELARGVLPAWLPTVYGGVPFFANPMDVYYPVSVLLRLSGLPVYTHLALLFLVQMIAAGVGGYLLLREIGARTLASAVTGAAFMFNGYLVSMVYGGHDNRTIVASLAPLVLFAIHRALRTGAAAWFLFMGFVLGAALLPFQIQSSYYLLLAAGLWFAFLLFRLGLTHRPRALLGRVAGGAGALVVAFSLAAVDLVPFAGYVPHSPRGGDEGRGYDYSVSWSMPPEEIVGLAVPERSGILDEYVGVNPLKLHMEYAGALTLLLCLAGGYVLRGHRKAWFFPALGLFGLTLAFGGYTPLYRLYYAYLPGISRFRSPASAFFLVSLGLVGFAGLALDRLHELGETSPEARDGRTAELLSSGGVLAVLGALLALAWAVVATVMGGRSFSGAPTAPGYVMGCWRFAAFAGVTAGVLWLWSRDRLGARTVGLVLLLVATADLWVVDRRFLHWVPGPDVYFAPDPVATFLSEHARGWRVHVLADLPQDDYLTYFGIELAAGEHGNQLQTYNEFLGGSDSAYTDLGNLENPVFLSLANVRYVVTSMPLEMPGLQPVFRGEHRGIPSVVYENENALPRAFLVPTAIHVPDRATLFARLSEPGFDPRAEVLLYGSSPPMRAAESSTPPEPVGVADVIDASPTEVTVEVQAPDPGYLVLTDNHYPDWHATVDGQPAELLRAYHTFRAVRVVAGNHLVRFEFRSASLRMGAVVTAATWAVLILSCLAALWKRASMGVAGKA